jgi:methionyl-tRNA synthetase
VLSADVYARFLRQRGVNVLYICGTDEYGTATETRAQQEGLSPREICDKYHALHRDVYDWFDIAFDEFGRTSTEHQTRIVQEVFWDVHKAGYIAEDVMTQLYCEAVCNRFLADRYVNGTCPNCGYEDARGDQCDNCGRMLNTTELVRPKCATCGNPPVTRSTKHLFLDLPKSEPQLKDWVHRAAVAGNWSANAVTLTNTWLRDGLKKRCITRDLKWGVPVPLEGYTDKVFYVWFDAPIGYLSITAGYGDRWSKSEGSQTGGDAIWRKWWTPAEHDDYNVELVQFMGKDNTPFHTIVFPSSLIATGKRWTLLHHISTTDYLNYEDGKFSKSRGVGVFGNDAKETGISTEVWRYYLLLNRPEGADATFTWADLAAKNNDELIKNLGNFINRTVSFLFKFFGGVVPNMLADDAENNSFVDRINKELEEYNHLMEKVSLKAALRKAMAISSLGNLYLQTKQPWILLKGQKKEEAGSSLKFAANLVILICVIFEPFLGSRFSAKVFRQLGLEHKSGSNNMIPDKFDPTAWVQPGSRTQQATILFPALEDARLQELRARYAGQNDSGVVQSQAGGDTSPDSQFSLDVRVGQIMDIADHRESERLFVAKVDVGEKTGPRTIVAGLRDVYKITDLRGRKVAIVCNLAPATLAGVESQGMILCAEKKKQTKALFVGENLSLGESLVPVGMPTRIASTPLDRPAFQLASKLLRVGKDGVIVYNKLHSLASVSDPHNVVTSSGVPEGGKVK